MEDINSGPSVKLPDRKRLGEMLCELRWRSRLSCKELCQKSGVPVETINQLESGECGVELPILIELLTAMQVQIDQFFQFYESQSDMSLGPVRTS